MRLVPARRAIRRARIFNAAGSDWRYQATPRHFYRQQERTFQSTFKDRQSDRSIDRGVRQTRNNRACSRLASAPCSLRGLCVRVYRHVQTHTRARGLPFAYGLKHSVVTAAGPRLLRNKVSPPVASVTSSGSSAGDLSPCAPRNPLSARKTISGPRVGSPDLVRYFFANHREQLEIVSPWISTPVSLPFRRSALCSAAPFVPSLSTPRAGPAYRKSC